MSARYFEKFPKITYNNSSCVNITERVSLLRSLANNALVFYPYDLSSGERADTFANRYYSNSYYSWILYLGNNIVDPYYQYYLDQEDFNRFLMKKYGSLAIAQTKVKYWENNWRYDSDAISISSYDDFPGIVQNYYEANYDNYGNISSYSRKQANTILNTNFVYNFTILNVENSNQFIEDEICYIYYNGEYSGNGQFLAISNTQVVLQHMQGNYNAAIKGIVADSVVFTADDGNITADVLSSDCFIVGSESEANVKFSAVAQSANNFHPFEQVFYSPVTIYQYEFDRNDSNKTINVLNNNYTLTINRNLQDLLRG